MSDEKKPVLVTLKSKPSGKEVKSKERQFEIGLANKLLKMKKSAWELSDSNFVFNGTEIAKKAK